jgi:division protein CdvB (Snf7/Vps24/ESCRT-III family)
LIGNWNRSKNRERLSQKVLDKVKPGVPLKSKIDLAQSKLSSQIIKLDSIHSKLQKKHDAIFNKIVDAQKSNHDAYARAYAIELHEIRKMNNMVGGAKLAMEQIQLRLNTVSELGDVVVTLSPCMSVIKGLGTSLGGLMPEANASMQDLSKILGDVLSGSAMGGHDLVSASDNSNAETLAILEEAHAVIEGQTKDSLPDLPDNLKHDIIQKREAYI